MKLKIEFYENNKIIENLSSISDYFKHIPSKGDEIHFPPDKIKVFIVDKVIHDIDIESEYEFTHNIRIELKCC